MIKKAIAVLVTLATIFSQSVNGFWSVQGSDIISTEGVVSALNCINFGNNVGSPNLSAVSRHHNEQSYKEISELGFNSVRFLLNYRWFEDDESPYSYKEEGFEMLEQNIKWAKKYGIGLILNMHYLQGGYQSLGEGMELWINRENQERLTALWKEIARRYADEPAIIGYGLINEPIVPLIGSTEESVDHSTSTGFSNNGCLSISGAAKNFSAKIAEIPMREGCRYVLSGYVNNADGSAYLSAGFALGEGFYSHDREYVFSRLDSFLSFREQNNVPLFLGEFGADIYAYDGLGGEQWTGDVIDWCQKNRVSLAFFAYHGELFGMYAGNEQYMGTGRFEALTDVFKQKLSNKTAA